MENTDPERSVVNADTVPRRTARMCGGFSLIEVLVALLVLSIGLLGLAALQLNGMKGVHAAYQRTLANVIAMDAGERLWLNLADPDPGPEDVRDAWLASWVNDPHSPGFHPDRLTLPGLEASTIQCSQGHCTIRVRWSEGRFDEPSNQSVLEYHLSLPAGGHP